MEEREREREREERLEEDFVLNLLTFVLSQETKRGADVVCLSQNNDIKGIVIRSST